MTAAVSCHRMKRLMLIHGAGLPAVKRLHAVKRLMLIHDQLQPLPGKCQPLLGTCQHVRTSMKRTWRLNDCLRELLRLRIHMACKNVTLLRVAITRLLWRESCA